MRVAHVSVIPCGVYLRLLQEWRDGIDFRTPQATPDRARHYERWSSRAKAWQEIDRSFRALALVARLRHAPDSIIKMHRKQWRLVQAAESAWTTISKKLEAVLHMQIVPPHGDQAPFVRL